MTVASVIPCGRLQVASENFTVGHVCTNCMIFLLHLRGQIPSARILEISSARCIGEQVSQCALIRGTSISALLLLSLLLSNNRSKAVTTCMNSLHRKHSNRWSCCVAKQCNTSGDAAMGRLGVVQVNFMDQQDGAIQTHKDQARRHHRHSCLLRPLRHCLVPSAAAVYSGSEGDDRLEKQAAAVSDYHAGSADS